MQVHLTLETPSLSILPLCDTILFFLSRIVTIYCYNILLQGPIVMGLVLFPHVIFLGLDSTILVIFSLGHFKL